MQPVRRLFGGHSLRRLMRVAAISVLVAAAAATIISAAAASSKEGGNVARTHAQVGLLSATSCDLPGGRERERSRCDLVGGVRPAAGTVAVTERTIVMSYRDGNDVVQERLVRRMLTGTFSGPEVSLVHNVTHTDGSADLTAVSSCSCTVEGRTGTVTFSERGRST